jgi:hypothetical protein
MHRMTTPLFLSTDEALAHLARFGVLTSRSGLDLARAEGRLPHVKARGRVRILYRPEDLEKAFLGVPECRLKSDAAGRYSTSGELSQDSAYMKALALATGQRPKSCAQGAKRKSSNVLPMAGPRPRPLQKPH